MLLRLDRAREALLSVDPGAGQSSPAMDRTAGTPLKRTPREGWDKAFAEAEQLAEADLAWLQFDNEGDDELRW
jgi:hypothetical protein